jgi:hypothetical protein
MEHIDRSTSRQRCAVGYDHRVELKAEAWLSVRTEQVSDARWGAGKYY